MEYIITEFSFSVPELLEAPSSLLVPVNTQAVFVCKVHCVRDCSLQWFIGNSSTRNQHQFDHYEAQGFEFSSYEDNGLHTLRLTINATLSNTNTSLRCHAVFNGRGATATTSDVAILQIVISMYLTMHLIECDRVMHSCGKIIDHSY